LHDDEQIVTALRRGPFEEAFQGFGRPTQGGFESARLLRFQDAVTALFDRLNKTFVNREFEFSNDLEWSVMRFLAKFDAIFTLNQDLLLEIHYINRFMPYGKFSGVVIPGMTAQPPVNHTGPYDMTLMTWRPTQNIATGSGFQPLYKLHGSSRWYTESGDPLLIMGNAKAGAIGQFPVIQEYHRQFAKHLSEGDAKLMVVGYSFQDEHINEVIERASRLNGLATYIVDLRGRGVLLDPTMDRAAIRPKRDIEHIKIIGELRRPLNSVFSTDAFAHGELIRFFR
jgi:SIR2-like domain